MRARGHARGWWVLVVCALGVAHQTKAEVEVKHWRIRGVLVHLVVAAPSEIRPAIALAEGTDLAAGRWGREGFSRMIARVKPQAAISGPHFNPADGRPVCSVVSGGRLLVEGLQHSALMLADGGARIAYTPAGRPPWPPHLRAGICGGPILVRDGVVEANQRDEGFRDPAIWGAARRTAVGLTPAGKLVMMGTNAEVGLRQWSHIARDCGLVDAFNLDGGGSAALYGGGQYLCRPTRRLPTFLVIQGKQ